MNKWPKDVQGWVNVELPKVITELGKEGPGRVMDVLAERYRAWLGVHCKRLGFPELAPVSPHSPEPGEAEEATEAHRKRASRHQKD